MSTGIPKTNFTTLNREFEDYIIDLRNGAAGQPNDPPQAVRKTIIFDDHTRLSCQEFIKDGVIDAYQYDFYDSNGNIVMKFHSEPHDEKHLQTKTEPFHLHVRSGPSDLKASVRTENHHHRELFGQIMPFITQGRNLVYAFTNSNVGNSTPTPTPSTPKRKGKSNKKR